MSPSSESASPRFHAAADVGVPGDAHRLSLEFSRRYITGRKVLDIGCWTGQYIMLARELAGEIAGMDVAQQALSVAAKSSPNAAFRHADLFDESLRLGLFDVVTMWMVLEHLPPGSEIRAFRQAAKLLCPGGHLLISVPRWHWFNNLVDPAFWLAGHRHYSLDRLALMLETAGYTVERVQFKNGPWYILFSNLNYLSKYLFGRHLDSRGWLARRAHREQADNRRGLADIYLAARKGEQ